MRSAISHVNQCCSLELCSSGCSAMDGGVSGGREGRDVTWSRRPPFEIAEGEESGGKVTPCHSTCVLLVSHPDKLSTESPRIDCAPQARRRQEIGLICGHSYQFGRR